LGIGTKEKKKREVVWDFL